MFSSLFEATPLHLTALLFCVWLVYGAALVFYRLYLSPISKFPGPKLAAATLWTEFYYDAIRGGQFQFKVKEWHEKYGMCLLRLWFRDRLGADLGVGPVVRINPHE
jgi:hypothetical protein